MSLNTTFKLFKRPGLYALGIALLMTSGCASAPEASVGNVALNTATPNARETNITETEQSTVIAQSIDEISVEGKYTNLQQVLNCPEDEATYGEAHDYGYWGGGDWCGQVGEAGYWAWSTPNWYVWAEESSADQVEASGYETASVGGKYSELKQVLTCEADEATYGSTHDYGYWGGGDWCGAVGEAGYWSWVAPNWYVWGSEES